LYGLKQTPRIWYKVLHIFRVTRLFSVQKGILFVQ
uniref:Uncharacterized protein n=1 Tax=Phytophthora ramorum TaxID=164328 RepID=H3G6K4_PHYRM